MPASHTGRRASSRRNRAFSAWSPGAAAASFCWTTVPSANSSAAPRARIASTRATLFPDPALVEPEEGGAEGERQRVLDPVPVQREDGDHREPRHASEGNRPLPSAHRTREQGAGGGGQDS